MDRLIRNYIVGDKKKVINLDKKDQLKDVIIDIKRASKNKTISASINIIVLYRKNTKKLDRKIESINRSIQKEFGNFGFIHLTHDEAPSDGKVSVDIHFEPYHIDYIEDSELPVVGEQSLN